MRDRQATSPQPSTAELVSQLSEQVTTLVRDEFALARAEMTEKGKRAGKGAGLIGAGGVLALYGLGALFVTIGALLALAMPVWLAALIVMVLIFAAAGVAALLGKKQVQQAVPPKPTAAVDSTKRDVPGGQVRDPRREFIMTNNFAASSKPAPTDPDELREEIARTRADLGETAAALAAKADVKARAKDKASQVAADAKDKANEVAARGPSPRRTWWPPAPRRRPVRCGTAPPGGRGHAAAGEGRRCRGRGPSSGAGGRARRHPVRRRRRDDSDPPTPALIPLTSPPALIPSRPGADPRVRWGRRGGVGPFRLRAGLVHQVEGRLGRLPDIATRACARSSRSAPRPAWLPRRRWRPRRRHAAGRGRWRTRSRSGRPGSGSPRPCCWRTGSTISQTPPGRPAIGDMPRPLAAGSPMSCRQSKLVTSP